uniref:Uncharacterized protein n=1 Tax=viral metagenome TaxID=1070528 RepID=A0A6C0HC35_9ZZZZ
MEEVNINDLVPDTDYYIQYEGADQDDYITNGNFTNVRKLGTFKSLRNVPGIGNAAHFINIRDVNTGKPGNEYPFPQGKMLLSSPPFYFYKVPSQVILQKIMDERANSDVAEYSKGILGGKKSRKNKKSKKSRKSRKNKKLKK